MKWLFTGFKPFSHHTENPSWEYAQKLAQSDQITGDKKAFQLDVSFQKTFSEFQEITDQYQPDLIVQLGLSGRAEKLHFEKVAINWVETDRKDNDGEFPVPQKILANKEQDGLITKWNVNNLLDLSQHQSIPAEISYHAGTYVCNSLYYQTMINYRQPTLFIHVPKTDSLEQDQELVIQKLAMILNQSLTAKSLQNG